MSANGLPFRAEHVGSLIEPPNLRAARETVAAGRMAPEELAHIHTEAVTATVNMQQDIGLRAITDGGFHHQPSRLEFFAAIEGIAFGSKPAQDGPVIRDRLARANPILRDDVRKLQDCVKETAKVTMPSPLALHLEKGRSIIDGSAYRDLDEVWIDLIRIWREEISELAEAGCRYIQLDDTAFACLCDRTWQQRIADRGEHWQSLSVTYARVLDEISRAKPKDLTLALHVSRSAILDGDARFSYDPVAEILLNEIAMDNFLMDYRDADEAGFAHMKHLPNGKLVILGVVNARDPRLESRDHLKRRIDQAARFAPVDQLALAPQSGFASGTEMTIDDQKRKLDLIVNTALDIWGSN